MNKDNTSNQNNNSSDLQGNGVSYISPYSNKPKKTEFDADFIEYKESINTNGSAPQEYQEKIEANFGLNKLPENIITEENEVRQVQPQQSQNMVNPTDFQKPQEKRYIKPEVTTVEAPKEKIIYETIEKESNGFLNFIRGLVGKLLGCVGCLLFIIATIVLLFIVYINI